MNPHIKQALYWLNRASIGEFFVEMDKAGVPEQHQSTLNTFRQRFIANDTPWDFSQQLQTFAREVGKELENPHPSSPAPTNVTTTNYFDLLENGEIAPLLRALLDNYRNNDLYSILVPINISFKEYEQDKLAGKNVQGQLQDITSRLSEILRQISNK